MLYFSSLTGQPVYIYGLLCRSTGIWDGLATTSKRIFFTISEIVTHLVQVSAMIFVILMHLRKSEHVWRIR